MPRKGLYQPWTSKNCLFLLSLSDEREIDWKDDFRPDDSKPATVKAVDEEDKGKTTDTWSGRPHREEAMLIQIKGSFNNPACSKCAGRHGCFKSCISVSDVHRGACGCCVWQSKAMECSLALEAVQSEAAAKKALLDAKDIIRQNRKRKNSSKNTARLKRLPMQPPPLLPIPRKRGERDSSEKFRHIPWFPRS